jgi:hypothetical protein
MRLISACFGRQVTRPARGQGDRRRGQLLVRDQVDVEVGVGEGRVDEGVGARPRGEGGHLAAVPSGEVDDVVFGEFGEFAADGFFGDVVEGGNASGADTGRMAARSGEAEKFASKSSCGSHSVT